MINFNLHAVMHAFLLIRQEYNLVAEGAHTAPEARLSENDQSRLREKLKHGIGHPLRALYIADDRLNTLFNLVEHRAAYAEVAHEFKALGSDLLKATQYERFCHYPREKGVLVVRVAGDWAATLKAFPTAKDDIEAAVDCYALGYNHASIYHSMMVLERGLPALARRLKVTVKRSRPTWKDMIDDIRRGMDAARVALAAPSKGRKPLARQATKRWHEILGHCGEVAQEFGFFEHAWRNHIAHGRAHYEESDAKTVLDHTRAFMELGASKLSLKERPSTAGGGRKKEKLDGKPAAEERVRCGLQRPLERSEVSPKYENCPSASSTEALAAVEHELSAH